MRGAMFAPPEDFSLRRVSRGVIVALVRVAAAVVVTGILPSWLALRAGAASHDMWVRDHGQVFTGTVTYPGLRHGAAFDASPHVYVGDVEADVNLRGAIGENQ